MARTFGAASKRLRSVRLNSRADGPFLAAILPRLQARATTPWQYLCAAWIDSHESGGRNLGWHMEGIGWSETDFEAQRAWLLSVFRDAAEAAVEPEDTPFRKGWLAASFEVLLAGAEAMTLDDVRAYRTTIFRRGKGPALAGHLAWLSSDSVELGNCTPTPPEPCPTCGWWIWYACSQCGRRALPGQVAFLARDMAHRTGSAPHALVLKATRYGGQVVLRGVREIEAGSANSVTDGTWSDLQAEARTVAASHGWQIVEEAVAD